MPEISKVNGEVYLVDDDPDLLNAMLETFSLADYQCTGFSDAAGVLQTIPVNWFGVIFCDIRMPGISGMDLLSTLQARQPDIPVILITGHADVSTAIAALKNGAYDFLEKPVAPDYMLELARRALEKRGLQLENQSLRAQRGSDNSLALRMIGNSPAMQTYRDKILTLSALNVDVLLIGETGTGKEISARCLHDYSSRVKENFVAINCGALPENTLDSELFGHEKGAFTGAGTRYKGRFEQANGGTLFLDELESMKHNAQVRLLRVLQEREIYRLGGYGPVKINVRVIAAIKQNPQRLVKEGTLREDLFFRLNIASLKIPALRDRRADVLILLDYFLPLVAQQHSLPVPKIDEKTRSTLSQYSWPGNVREVRNIAERLVIGLAVDMQNEMHPEQTIIPLDDAIAAYEKRKISAALSNAHGIVGIAAQMLDIPRKRLYLRMKFHHLNKDDFTGNLT